MIGLIAPFGLALLLLIAAVAAVMILSAVVAYDAVHPPRHTAGWAMARGLPGDPGDKGLEFESWTLELPRDVKLPVWEIAARGDGPTAVFVHDWGEARIDMLTQLDPWLGRSERIVLYDRRGHGEATGGIAMLGTGEDRDLRALLDRLGEGPFILVGHGGGAGVASAAASTPDAAAITEVVTDGRAGDVRGAIRDRLHARGLPAQPLGDLALFWLWCIGLRPRDVVRDAATSGAG